MMAVCHPAGTFFPPMQLERIEAVRSVALEFCIVQYCPSMIMVLFLLLSWVFYLDLSMKFCGVSRKFSVSEL